MLFSQIDRIFSWSQLREILIDSQNLKYFLIAIVLLEVCYIWFLLARKHIKLRPSFIVFATLINILYLVWRIGFTLPTISLFSFIFSITLISAELLGFLQSLVYRRLFITPIKSKPVLFSALGYYPTVDIMITTYDEPDIVIRRTVAGATQLDYPAEKLNIYVCDDGSRAAIKAVCDDYNAHWITREEHLDAKAGNLNHCYKNHASGDFSVILDADMVPRSDFLINTLGYFEDPDVAFVQTPQVFFNPDSFQRNLGLNDDIPNEQDFFMQEIQAHRQEYNALLFVGSGCVFRRTHLEKIGFIPTGTITEDMATSLLLQNEGYKGRLTNRTFAQGLSAESFVDYAHQRTRWAQGNIDVFKKWNPWKMKNLTFAQKAIITDGVSYWLFGLQKMVYILSPMVFILLGIPIMITNPIYLLVFWLPAFIINNLVMKVFSHRFRTSGWSHIYETAIAPHLAVAALRALIFSKKRKFEVTPKGQEHEDTSFTLSVAKPHLILLGLSFLSLGIVAFKIVTATNVSTIIVFALNGVWVIYNLFAIIASIALCLEKPRVRKYDRLTMSIDIPIALDNQNGFSGRLNNVSEGGCNISPKNVVDPDTFVDKKIALHITGDILEGTILRYIPGKNAYAVKFDDMTKDTYARLVKFIFSSQNTGFGDLKDRRVLHALVSQFFENIRVRMIKKAYHRRNRNKIPVKSSRSKLSKHVMTMKEKRQKKREKRNRF